MPTAGTANGTHKPHARRFALAAKCAAALLTVAILALLLFLAPGHEWNWQLGRWAAGVRPLLFNSLAAETAALSVVCAAALALSGGKAARVAAAVLALALATAQVCCLAAAYPHLRAGTGIPWGVDHPAFLYRLHEIRAVFPALGGWNPWWNGGTEHFFSVTSGSHGWALLVSPLLAFLDPGVFEGWAIFAWLFVLFPWIAVMSLRMCGARWTAALSAGLAELALSRSGFLYFWQYGIVGGLTTVGMTLPLCALAYRVAAQRRGGWPCAAMLGLVAWISCLWTPGFFTCAGLVAAVLPGFRRMARGTRARLVFAAVLALVLLSPWIWTTLVVSRGVVGFVGASPASGHSHATLLYHGIRHCLRRIAAWHPAVLALGVAGLPLAPRRLRRLVAPCLAVLFAAIVSYAWKRQSQFDRLAFQAAAVAVLPASVAIGRLYARCAMRGAAPLRRFFLCAAAGMATASLLVGARIAYLHAGNGAGFKFWTAEPVVAEMAEWIAGNVPKGGRLAFSGATGNKLDWGTVTYMPILSGREMMAADYYSFPRGFVELNYPPKFYRQSTESFLFFSRAYGITHWAVADARTLRFCEEESGHFALAASFQTQSTQWRIYAVTDDWAKGMSRFYEGAGEVDASERRIRVRPADASAERLVLRYNWRPGLFCRTPGASIEPFQVDGNLRFIAVHPNGAQEIDIGYRAGNRALGPNFDGTFHH